MNEKSKPTVTVEDLLRVKRAERPTAEFWADFDRELRAKQLAALVAKRPWWNALPRFLREVVRHQLPIGATAVLAITLVSLRNYQPVVRVHNAGQIETPMPAAVPPVSVSDQRASAVAGSDKAVTDTVADDQAVESTDAREVVPASSSRLVPVIQTRTEFATNRDEDRPSARSIAENRAVAEAMLGTRSGFEARALPTRMVTQEPLTQVSNPSEARRSRFATAFAAAAIGTSPVPTTRVASRLSDEQLYDTIHRFGASGNTLSFKF